MYTHESIYSGVVEPGEVNGAIASPNNIRIRVSPI